MQIRPTTLLSAAAFAAALALAPTVVLAQATPAPQPQTADSNAVQCPHPTAEPLDHYGCMPKPGGGARRAVADPMTDPRKKAAKSS